MTTPTAEELAFTRRTVQDPVLWVETNLRCQLWSEQKAILRALAVSERVAVKSCHAIGKTFVSSCAVLWWMFTRWPAYVITTAPTSHQVERLLWKEIRAGWQRLPGDMQCEGECLTMDIKMRSDTGGWDPLHYAYGRSTDKPGRFQGEHARHLMIVVDEASEVDEDIFGIIDTFGAEKLLLIGNPIHPGGRFHRAHQNPSLGYATLSIAAEQTPNFTGEPVAHAVANQLIRPENVEQWAREWGEDSAWYQARVLAEFPEAGADRVIVPMDWFMAAQRRTSNNGKVHRTEIGVDVARGGSDSSALCVRRGADLLSLRSLPSSLTTQQLSAEVREEAERHAGEVLVRIDRTGVGAGVTDILTPESDGRVTYRGVSFAEAAVDRDRFAGIRDEMYWHLRERFREGSPVDAACITATGAGVDRLGAQVSAVRFGYDVRGRVKVESKEDMRKRGMPSPDEADAAALAFMETKPSGAWMQVL